MALLFDGARGKTISKKLAWDPAAEAAAQAPKAAIGKNSPGYGVLTSSPAQRQTTSAGTSNDSGGGGGGGSYGGGGGGGGGDVYNGGSGYVNPFTAPAPPPPPSQNDFLSSDDVYLAALSRYNKNFDDLIADITRREGDYSTTYANSLGDLGYITGAEGAPGRWDFENQQTAAGRGYQSILQDFAARGLLHSGDYLGAQNDFTGQLGKQLNAMNLAKQQFGEGLNQERTTGKSSRDAGIGQARAEALARYAQLYGAV